jgi:hypothetical protein
MTSSTVGTRLRLTTDVALVAGSEVTLRA